MSSFETINVDDLKFKIPFGMIISGPSNSGKTHFLLKLLKYSEQLFKPIPKTILYVYGEYHSFIPELESEGIRICAGMPTDDMLSELPRPFLLVLDDLMLIVRENTLSELFTKKAHHQNFGVIFVTQNLFEKSMRVARNNSQYLVLMRAPNAVMQIRNLGAQLFPGQLQYFLDAYRQATLLPYGYLVLDLHAGSSPLLKVRTNIFPEESEIEKQRTVFIPSRY